MFRSSHKPFYASVNYWLHFIIFSTLVFALLVFFLQLSYRQNESSIKIACENESHVIAGELNASFRRIRSLFNVISKEISHVLNDQLLYQHFNDNSTAHLNLFCEDFPEVISFSYYDDAGRIVFSSDEYRAIDDVSQEYFFRESKRSVLKGVMFSEVKSTKPMSLIAYQQLHDRQGGFVGILAAVINLDYFQQFLREVDVGTRGMVSVRRSDDSRLVFRWPVVLSKINNSAPDIPPQRRIQDGEEGGVVRYVGATDGVDRIFAFHKIHQFPFYVLVGRAYKEQFVAWFQMATTTSLLTLFFLTLLGWYLNRLRASDKRVLQSEQYLQAIINSQNDAVCRWLPDTAVTFANSQCCKLLGFSGPDALVGYKWVVGFEKDEQQAILAYSKKLFENARVTARKRIFRLQDGSERMFHWVDVPLFNSEGKCIEMQSVGRDITDIMNAELEKEELQRHLNQAQKMESIGFLAGGIAHDFNNILGVIIGNSEMATEMLPPNHPAAGFIGRVLQAGQRASELTSQILAFSRQSETVYSTFAPQKVLRESLKLLRSTIPSTISIVQDIEAGEYYIHADPIQFHQIVVNICTNASYAMEQSGGVLTLIMRTCELGAEQLEKFPEVKPGVFVELIIRDTGTGMEPDVLSKIFDPYFTTKQVGKGSGMGLAIVHGIVTAAKGFITCESEVGQGAAFHILLPVSEKSEVESVDSGEILQGGGEHILLVDDEPMLTEAGVSILENLGYTVTAFNSSTEALAAFQAHPMLFDMVITDQTMPQKTGVDMARSMLKLRADLPIILCTGYSSIIDEEAAKRHGIRGFAVKPVKIKEMAVLIRKLLSS